MQGTIDFVLALLFAEVVTHRMKGLQILSLLFIRQMRDRGFFLEGICRDMILIRQLRLPAYIFAHALLVARVQLVVFRDVQVVFMMRVCMIRNFTAATDLSVRAEIAVGQCLLAGDTINRAIISRGHWDRLMRFADMMLRVLQLRDTRISDIRAGAMTAVAGVDRWYVELGLRMMLMG